MLPGRGQGFDVRIPGQLLGLVQHAPEADVRVDGVEF
jgi:hypothetical protein